MIGQLMKIDMRSPVKSSTGPAGDAGLCLLLHERRDIVIHRRRLLAAERRIAEKGTVPYGCSIEA
jgi:hypothetical protein